MSRDEQRSEARSCGKDFRTAGRQQIVRNFLFVIIDHRRTRELPKILATFQDVLRERQGIAEAEVFSAVALNDAQKKDMAQNLERATARRLQQNFRWMRSCLAACWFALATQFTMDRCAIG